MIFAAIDIGSNAIRLLIAEARPYQDTTDFTKLQLVRIPLRLGFDVFEKGRISAAKKAKLTEAMLAYRHLMHVYGAKVYRACATAAMREASNGREIAAHLRSTSGIRVEIITGQEEAEIIYEANMDFDSSGDIPNLFIDVGGGSTELSLFIPGQQTLKQSFPIGTIRLLKDQVNDTHWNELKSFIKEQIGGDRPVRAIGTGGNINKIQSLSKKKTGKPLSLELLKTYHKELSALSIEERMHNFRLRADRADVIVPALQIYLSVLRWAGLKEICVPGIGLADGLIRKLYRQQSSSLK